MADAEEHLGRLALEEVGPEPGLPSLAELAAWQPCKVSVDAGSQRRPDARLCIAAAAAAAATRACSPPPAWPTAPALAPAHSVPPPRLTSSSGRVATACAALPLTTWVQDWAGLPQALLGGILRQVLEAHASVEDVVRAWQVSSSRMQAAGGAVGVVHVPLVLLSGGHGAGLAGEEGVRPDCQADGWLHACPAAVGCGPGR